MSQDQNYRTRHEQHPDWMVRGLLHFGGFAKDEPQRPMFNTGVSYAELKDQVRSMLQRSGLDLTKAEMSQGTHWLTERIANLVGESDTRETLAGYLVEYVNQYIVDKSLQRTTGIANRGPIYSREWYDKYFGNPPDKDANQIGRMRRFAQVAGVYIGLDGDDIGGLVEETLLTDDADKAQKISMDIHRAHRRIRDIVKDRGGRIIFDGGDNMLVYMGYDPDVVEAMRLTYREETGHSATVGVGHRPIEAHWALVVGKNTGKDKTVVYDERAKQQYDEIRKKQQELAPIYQQLKYEAQAEVEHEVAPALTKAMIGLGLMTNEEAVYEMLMRIVERFGLTDADEIIRVCSDPRLLRSAIRMTYARRLDWKIVTANRELTGFEMDGVLRDLQKFVGLIEEIGGRFENAEDKLGSDNPVIKAMAEELEGAKARCGTALAQVCDLVNGDRLRHSTYVEEIGGIVASVVVLSQKIDQEITTLLRSKDNAQPSDEGKSPSVNAQVLSEQMTEVIECIGLMSMILEMICVSSNADPKTLVAANVPQTFPGQGNVPRSKNQTPHSKKTLTVEEHNKDSVDWSGTDWQYTSTNIPRESQVAVGGDPGGSPIYVP